MQVRKLSVLVQCADNPVVDRDQGLGLRQNSAEAAVGPAAGATVVGIVVGIVAAQDPRLEQQGAPGPGGAVNSY
jgi:hypothetical protein